MLMLLLLRIWQHPTAQTLNQHDMSLWTKQKCYRNKGSLVSNDVEPALAWFAIHDVFLVRTTPGKVGRAPVVVGRRRLPESLHNHRCSWRISVMTVIKSARPVMLFVPPTFLWNERWLEISHHVGWLFSARDVTHRSQDGNERQNFVKVRRNKWFLFCFVLFCFVLFCFVLFFVCLFVCLFGLFVCFVLFCYF